MKKMALVALATVLLTTGCATQTYTLSNHAQSQARYDKMQTFFISGLAQEQEVNAADICGGADKVAKVQTELTVVNWLLGTVSQGIYTPRQMRVFCK